MEEIDIWRTAAIMMKQYPEDAAIIAAMRADAFLDQGDPEGFAVWKRVVAAINELERKPCDGEPMN